MALSWSSRAVDLLLGFGLYSGFRGDDGFFDLNSAGGYGSDRSHGLSSLLVGISLRGDVQRLGALGVVAVDGDGLETLTPALM